MILFPSHAVEDETQEDECVVAVVDFHILDNPLTHHSKVTWLGELALVHKAGPGTNRHPTPVDPLLSYVGGKSFREPESGKSRQNSPVK